VGQCDTWMTPLCRDASIHGLRGHESKVGCLRTINMHRDAPSPYAGAGKAWKGAGALPAISHLFGWKERPFTRLLLVSNCAMATRIVSVVLANSMLPCAEGRSLTFVSIVEPSPLRLCSFQLSMPSAGCRIGSGAQLDMAEQAVGQRSTYNVLRSIDPVRKQRVHRHRPAINAIEGENPARVPGSALENLGAMSS